MWKCQKSLGERLWIHVQVPTWVRVHLYGLCQSLMASSGLFINWRNVCHEWRWKRCMIKSRDSGQDLHPTDGWQPWCPGRVILVQPIWLVKWPLPGGSRLRENSFNKWQGQTPVVDHAYGTDQFFHCMIELILRDLPWQICMLYFADTDLHIEESPPSLVGSPALHAAEVSDAQFQEMPLCQGPCCLLGPCGLWTWPQLDPQNTVKVRT